MSRTLLLLLCLPSVALATTLRSRASRNVPSEGYYDPNSNGGSLLTQVPGTFPEGQSEPINIILSGNSDEIVLQDNHGGLRSYYQSLGFSGECLGQHSGSDQAANLGDGNGFKNETAVIRWNYGDPQLGTCQETVKGGNHFRYWVQNGNSANSGAIFMAMSYELPIAQQHDIVTNGYNLARDYLIGNLTGSAIPTSDLTNTSTYSASSSSDGFTYQTDVQYVSGLLPNTSIGINHNVTVSTPVSNACDGLVAVLTVKITSKPASNFSSTMAAPRIPTLITLLSLLMLAIPLSL